MLAPTHSVFGAFLTLIILGVFGIPSSLHWTVIICAVIGSLAPDLDTRKSLIGKLLPFISGPIERKFGHRTATHSLIGWTIANLGFGILLAFLFLAYYKTTPWSINYFRMVAAFSFGYLSHLILDMFNPRGVQLLWPDIGRDVIPKNADFRPESGSKTEILIFLILTCLLGFAFPLSQYGLMTSLRWFLATPEAAISEFKATQEKAYVEFEGVHNETRTHVSGLAEVLDVQNKKLIILYNNVVFSLSDELAADILAKKVHLIKTKTPIQTTHSTFKNKTREELFNALPKTGLVSGIITLPRDLKINFEDVPNGVTSAKNTSGYLASTFKPLDQVGNELRLHFATKDQVAALKLNESFYLLQKQRIQTIAKLQLERRQVQTKLQTLNTPSGLTPLGESILVSQEDKEKKAQKQEELQNKLEELTLQIETLQAEQKSERLLFSGNVMVRK